MQYFCEKRECLLFLNLCMNSCVNHKSSPLGRTQSACRWGRPSHPPFTTHIAPNWWTGHVPSLRRLKPVPREDMFPYKHAANRQRTHVRAHQLVAAVEAVGNAVAFGDGIFVLAFVVAIVAQLVAHCTRHVHIFRGPGFPTHACSSSPPAARYNPHCVSTTPVSDNFRQLSRYFWRHDDLNLPLV
jgi:hypothetical protein